MAAKVKPGLIANGVRVLGKADYKPHILVNSGFMRRKCLLSVTENGDTRTLPISRKVAEVLIANGFSYGN